MKRAFLSFLLALAAAFTLTAPLSADIIWEPEDNFYKKHHDECTYVGRQYETAGYDGAVTVWRAPDGAVLETVPNGKRGTVQFRWSGSGVAWGYISGYSGDWDHGGWAPMDDLSLVYDSQQFMEEHEVENTPFDPVPVEFHSAVLYGYPGGPAGRVLHEDTDYMPFSEVFTEIYTDENGLRWGYVGYYMGRQNSWVCLDDPMNENLDTNVVPVAPSAAQLRGSATVTPGAAQQLPLILAGVLVAAVVAVTAFVLRKMQSGKKPKP